MANSPARAALDVGSVIADTYRLEALIGRGGMGAVFLASHTRLPGKKLAIKLLHAELHDDEVRARFRREAEIASRLGHPNIVTAHDFNVTPEGTPYLVLEYLEGQTLAQRIAAGPVPLDQALSIVRQVGGALAAAHREGIVHRDLKPQNIFLVATEVDGRVVEIAKVLDFGISKIRGSQTVKTQESALLGTPQYMAPEQATGQHERVDGRTDVFALGAIVYEMLTGQPPFTGASIPEVVFKVVYEQPAPMAGGVPAPIATAVAQAMAKPIEDRFPSVSGFVEALTGQPLPALRPSAPGRPEAADAPGPARITSPDAMARTVDSGDHGPAALARTVGSGDHGPAALARTVDTGDHRPSAALARTVDTGDHQASARVHASVPAPGPAFAPEVPARPAATDEPVRDLAGRRAPRRGGALQIAGGLAGVLATAAITFAVMKDDAPAAPAGPEQPALVAGSVPAAPAAASAPDEPQPGRAPAPSATPDHVPSSAAPPPAAPTATAHASEAPEPAPAATAAPTTTARIAAIETPPAAPRSRAPARPRPASAPAPQPKDDDGEEGHAAGVSAQLRDTTAALTSGDDERVYRLARSVINSATASPRQVASAHVLRATAACRQRDLEVAMADVRALARFKAHRRRALDACHAVRMLTEVK